jgi:hypothetical protein
MNLQTRILLHLYQQAPDEKVTLKQLGEELGVSALGKVRDALAYLMDRDWIGLKSLGPLAMLCWITSDGRDVVRDLIEQDASEDGSATSPPLSTRVDYQNLETSPGPPMFIWDLEGLSPLRRRVIQRQDFVDRISKVLEDSDDRRIVLLYGQPLVGKTFVLARLQDALQERYTPVFIHMNGWSSTRRQLDFLNELATSIQIDIESLRPGVEISPFRRASELQATAEFSRFMYDASKSVGADDRPFLLMFDEFEYLAREETDGRIFDYLVGFIESYYQRVRFVFAGSGDMFDLMENTALVKILAKGHKVCVDCFDEEVSRDLVVAMTSRYFALEPQALEKIVYLVNGHPGLQKEVLRIIVRCWRNESRKDIVSEGDINAALEDVRIELSPKLHDIWFGLSMQERDLLQQVAGIERRSFEEHEFSGLKRYHTRKHLKRLVDRQILSSTSKGSLYTIRLGLLVDSIVYGILS